MPFTTTITPANIATALGVAPPEGDSPTYDQWFMWISDALMLIQDRADELAVTVIDQAKLDYVVRESVVAQAKHPDDATQVTVSVDDGSTQKSYRSSNGRVSIPDDLWTLLGLTEPSGAFAIDMVPTSTAHQPWCNLYFGASYCSCGADIAGYPIYEDC